MKNYLILHIPHAGTVLAPDTAPYLVDVEAERMLVTDWHTGDLFTGHESVEFPFSRLSCDVERLIPDPLDEKGQGFFYTRTLDGRALRVDSPLARECARALYDKHHDMLDAAVAKAISLMPVVIIDAHSYSVEQVRLTGWEGPCPDICLGYEQARISPGLISDLCILFGRMGFTVGLNIPYQGALMPKSYQEHPDVRSIMIDVNKRLYLEEGTNRKSMTYPFVREALSAAMIAIENFDFSAA